MEIKSAVFVKSAPNLVGCPNNTTLPEFTFVGRSNVGKSTLINMLTGKKQLAKASSVPGKTQLINYFLINDCRYLVDLPGYGYARYGTNKRIQWMDTMQEYLTRRNIIKKIFVLIDGSIPPQKIDLDFMYVLFEEHLDFVIVITKIDKTSQKEVNENVSDLKISLKKMFGEIPEIFFTSSEKNRGKQEILDFLGSIVSFKNNSDFGLKTI